MTFDRMVKMIISRSPWVSDREYEVDYKVTEEEKRKEGIRAAAAHLDDMKLLYIQRMTQDYTTRPSIERIKFIQEVANARSTREAEDILDRYRH